MTSPTNIGQGTVLAGWLAEPTNGRSLKSSTRVVQNIDTSGPASGIEGMGVERAEGVARQTEGRALPKDAAASGASLDTQVRINAPELSETDSGIVIRKDFRHMSRQITNLNNYVLRDVKSPSGFEDRRGCCGKIMRSGDAMVEIRRDDTGRLSSANLMRCGSIWACLRCASFIKQERALQMQHIFDDHFTKQGRCVLFLTMTLPHRLGDDPVVLRDTLAEVWRTVTRSRVWRGLKDKLNIRYVGTLEWMYSLDTGFHPHYHTALLLDEWISPQLQKDLWDSLEKLVYASTKRVVAKRLGRKVSRQGQDLRIARNPDALAGYVSKLASELTLDMFKTGRNVRSYNMWQIAGEAANGAGWAVNVWEQWLKVSKGQRFITFSRGLLDEFGVEDKTDREIAERAEHGLETIGEVSSRAWLMLHNTFGGVACFIDAWETNGIDSALNVFVEHTGVVPRLSESDGRHILVLPDEQYGQVQL